MTRATPSVAPARWGIYRKREGGVGVVRISGPSLDNVPATFLVYPIVARNHTRFAKRLADATSDGEDRVIVNRPAQAQIIRR